MDSHEHTQTSAMADLELRGNIALITITHPPVNALSLAVRQGVSRCLDLAEQK